MKKVLVPALALSALLGFLYIHAAAAPYPTGVGGTGTSVSPAAGQVLIGTGSSTYTPAYILCAGTCSASSASGTITITGTGVATDTGNWAGMWQLFNPSDFLSSSTEKVVSVNGLSGVVTISSSSLGVVWPTVNGNKATNYSIVPGTGVTSTVSGATTTISVNLDNGAVQTCSANQFVNSIAGTGVATCGSISFPAVTVNLTGSSTPNAVINWLDSSGDVRASSSLYCFADEDCSVGTSTDFGIPFAVYATTTWNNLSSSTYSPALSVDSYGDALTNGVGNYTTSAGWMANYPQTVITTNSTTTGWTTSGTGSISIETPTPLYPTPFVKGTGAMQITTGVPGSAFTAKDYGTATTSFVGQNIVFWLNFASSTNIQNVELFAGSGGSTTNSYEWIVSNLDPAGSPEADYFQPGVWTPITLAFDPNNMTVNGTPNRAAINAYAIKVLDGGAATTTIYVNGISSIPEPKQGVISFSFDDAYYSEFTNGLSALSQYGYPATVFDVITNNNNTSSYPDNNGGPEFMTTQQLQTLQNQNGWDIACHTYDHPDLTGVSSSQLLSELVRCQNWLKVNGLSRAANVLAWPFGDFNTSTIQAASPYFVVSRGTEGEQFETIPPANPYNLRALQLGNTISSATVEADILSAMQNNEWLILYGHEITNGPATTENQMTSSTFNAIVNYAASVGANVKTISDVVNGLNGNSSWQDASAASDTLAAYDGSGNLTSATIGSGLSYASGTLSNTITNAVVTSTPNSSGTLQVFSGTNAITDYAGSTCAGGQFATSISASGTVACSTPATGSGSTTINNAAGPFTFTISTSSAGSASIGASTSGGSSTIAFTVPAGGWLGATTTVTTITTTTLTTAYSLTVPGNMLGSHALLFNVGGSFEQDAAGTVSPFIFNVTYCGLSVASGSMQTTSQASQPGAWGGQVLLMDASGTQFQAATINLIGHKGSSNLTLVTASNGFINCDSTQSQLVTIQLANGTSTATQITTLGFADANLQ